MKVIGSGSKVMDDKAKALQEDIGIQARSIFHMVLFNSTFLV